MLPELNLFYMDGLSLEEHIIKILYEGLEYHEGNRWKTAQALKISYSTVNKKIRENPELEKVIRRVRGGKREGSGRKKSSNQKPNKKETQSS